MKSVQEGPLPEKNVRKVYKMAARQPSGKGRSVRGGRPETPQGWGNRVAPCSRRGAGEKGVRGRAFGLLLDAQNGMPVSVVVRISKRLPV